MIPQCCSKAEELYLESLINTSPLTSRTSSPHYQTSSPSRQDSPPPPIQGDTSFGGHRGSHSSVCSNSTTSSGAIFNPVTPPPPPSPQAVSTEQAIEASIFERVSPQESYYNYLTESQIAIEECTKGCQCWSSCYGDCVVSEEREIVTNSVVDTTISSVEVESLTLSVPLRHNNHDSDGLLMVSHDSHVTASSRVSPRSQRKNLLDPLTVGSRFNDQVS